MIKQILVFALFLLLAVGCSKQKEEAQQPAEQTTQVNEFEIPDGVIISKQTEPDTLKGSIKSYASTKIGPATITLTYHSPAVRGRIIWGGLVPLDQVWVTGAHMATTLESDYDFMMGDKSIPAGKYGLFTIPGKEKWTIILNKNWQQHLTDEYKSEEDVVRMLITPKLQTENQERLQYEVTAFNQSEFAINIRWDKLLIAIPATIINPEFD